MKCGQSARSIQEACDSLSPVLARIDNTHPIMPEIDYLEIFLEPIRKCAYYTPKFGSSVRKQGLVLVDFKNLYGSDPFYSWIGLDSDLMYAAHKAAGGMTSVYRQIGIGCERLFREVLFDAAGYADRASVTWSYSAKTRSGEPKKLSLDGRLGLEDIARQDVRERTRKWLEDYCKQLDIPAVPRRGAVFEIRQGYKSKDSKRQNADIDNATVAWSHGYLPVFAVFSSQIDSDIVLRYRNNRCGILTGIRDSGPFSSLYDFMDEVIGYDLAGFFEANRRTIRKEIEDILETLLRPE